VTEGKPEAADHGHFHAKTSIADIAAEVAMKMKKERGQDVRGIRSNFRYGFLTILDKVLTIGESAGG
jgi:hypothetical protein